MCSSQRVVRFITKYNEAALAMESSWTSCSRAFNCFLCLARLLLSCSLSAGRFKLCRGETACEEATAPSNHHNWLPESVTALMHYENTDSEGESYLEPTHGKTERRKEPPYIYTCTQKAPGCVSFSAYWPSLYIVT